MAKGDIKNKISKPRKIRKKREGRAAQLKIQIEHSDLYPYLVHYLEWHKVKGYSVATMERHDNILRRFIAWCDERGIHDPKVVTKPILERYQRHLYYYRKANGQPLGFGTQHNFLAAVKAWFKWMTRENYLASNPASEVQSIRVPNKLPDAVLSVEDVQHILNAIDVNDIEGLRNRAIVEVLYGTGVRRTELCNLLLSDIDSHRQSVFVREGKGAKDRCIPIGKRALVWVRRYLEDSRPKLLTHDTEHHLFLNAHGDAFTPSYLGHTVKRIIKAAGLDRKGGCHLFRHAMATHMLENGAELRYIQAILGHANINTTTIYTHMSIESLLQVHELSHPLKSIM